MKRIMVVSPHPDDETLGAGGYLLKEQGGGSFIYWLNITNVKEEYGFSKEKCMSRNKELQEVKKEYLFEDFFNLELEPAGLDKYEKKFLVQEIGKILEMVKPNIVIVPNPTDIHSDHKIVFEATWSCTKAFRAPWIERVMTMQILSETDCSIPEEGFVPNFYVDIEDVLEDKIKIAKIYKSELLKSPFPRNEDALRAQAVVNGAASYCKAAEAFRIIKMVER